jgi:hypothetical protein
LFQGVASLEIAGARAVAGVIGVLERVPTPDFIATTRRLHFSTVVAIPRWQLPLKPVVDEGEFFIPVKTPKANRGVYSGIVGHCLLRRAGRRRDEQIPGVSLSDSTGWEKERCPRLAFGFEGV